MLSSTVQERKFKFLVFDFLWAEQISFSAELSMKKSFITLDPGSKLCDSLKVVHMFGL